MSAVFQERLSTFGRQHPRSVGLDPRFQQLLPEVVLAIGPDDFANLAARALEPKIPDNISISHIHAPRVSVREQAAIMADRLKRTNVATFRQLTIDCDTTLLVVARFLALLELYRDGVVLFDQPTALGELTVRWVADENQQWGQNIDEFDHANVEVPEFAVVQEESELAQAEAASDERPQFVADDDDDADDDEDEDDEDER
jgi:segregation and condensation protein A